MTTGCQRTTVPQRTPLVFDIFRATKFDRTKRNRTQLFRSKQLKVQQQRGCGSVLCAVAGAVASAVVASGETRTKNSITSSFVCFAVHCQRLLVVILRAVQFRRIKQDGRGPCRTTKSVPKHGLGSERKGFVAFGLGKNAVQVIGDVLVNGNSRVRVVYDKFMFAQWKWNWVGVPDHRCCQGMFVVLNDVGIDIDHQLILEHRLQLI